MSIDTTKSALKNMDTSLAQKVALGLGAAYLAKKGYDKITAKKRAVDKYLGSSKRNKNHYDADYDIPQIASDLASATGR